MGKTIVFVILGAVITFCFGILVKTTIELIQHKCHQKKVVKFFETHKPKVGCLKSCEKFEGETKLTYEFQGKYKPSKPNYRCIPNQYYVTVTVRDGVTPKYNVTYLIPKDDYKYLKNKVKQYDEIEIKSTWHGVDFFVFVK